MANHQLRIYSPAGVFLREMRWKSIDVTLSEREITPLTVSLFPDHSDAYFQRDCRLAYLRDGRLVGDTMWLLRGRERVQNDRGEHTIVLRCQHPNAILGSRVVAYDEGSAEADKSDIGSDNMYDYVDENFVSATDTTRNISTSHFVLDPRPAPTFGASIDIAGSYRNVLDILQEITQASAAQGSYIGYEVYVREPPGPFRVRFYKQVRGTNRGLTSVDRLIVRPQYAFSGSSNVMEDWTDLVTLVYAGGEGKGDERHVQPQSDSTLIAQSPFGLIEHFESFNTDSDAILLSEAYKVLRDYRPRRLFAAEGTPKVQQGGTPPRYDADYAFGDIVGPQYDLDYTWGDIIGAEFIAPVLASGEGVPWVIYQFDVRVNPVHLQVVRQFDEYGTLLGQEETTEIHLQSVDSI